MYEDYISLSICITHCLFLMLVPDKSLKGMHLTFPYINSLNSTNAPFITMSAGFEVVVLRTLKGAASPSELPRTSTDRRVYMHHVYLL